MNSRVRAAFYLLLSFGLMAACGSSAEESEAANPAGTWEASISAGMGGADPNPPATVVTDFSEDGTGTMDFLHMGETDIRVVFTVQWSEIESGSYLVVLTCSSVTPEDPEIGLTCDALGGAVMACEVEGDQMVCDDSETTLEFVRR